ncbi:MAG: toll/interleukin-1 receptor domain-containing protein [Dehalococcoidia bacterium]|nr:toll/interleukin-1 receptor domain-containing protein [Dehalococcoidia bacterium]
MAGRNRYFPGRLNEQVMLKAASAATSVCVFISHKWEDKEAAQVVARELAELGIDYWLDIDDDASVSAAQARDDKALSEAIERGIQNSSHLLALLTPRTKGSWWVPYEIGAARAYSRSLVFLIHKDLKDRPAWLSLGQKVIASKPDLDAWAETLTSNHRLIEMRKAASYRSIDSVLSRWGY